MVISTRWQSSLQVIGGLLAATLFVEAALDVIEASPLWRVLPVAEIAPYGPDPDTGYRHRPNVSGVWLTENRARIAISPLGLRDRKRSPQQSGGSRAVVLGNSLIEALQVEQRQTAVTVAEEGLRQMRPNAEVINLGLAGATPPIYVARLRSAALPLKPDVAVIVLAGSELRAETTGSDEKAPGYRPDADGNPTLSYGFRETSGFRFRSSVASRLIYSLIDHSAVARLLNNRKNVGFFAEWPGTHAEPTGLTEAVASGCNEPELAQAGALWTDGTPTQDRAVRDAFLRDLGRTAADNKIRIVIALRGISTACAGWAERRAAVVAAARTRVAGAGLLFADFDQEVADIAGGDVTRLYGFGGNRAGGHLNLEGNRVWGKALAEIIGSALAEPLPREAPAAR